MRSISRTKQLAAAGTLVLVGFGAGATAMVAGSASAEDAAETPSATPDAGTDGPRGHGGPGGRGGPGAGETPLTGDTLARVTAAVEADYPGATVERAETDNGGVYEAHVTTADDERLTVLVGEDFTVTGTEEPPAGGRGPGGPGGPKAELTGDDLAAVTAAVEADYPGATIDHTHVEGEGFEAHVTTADGDRLEVQLDADHEITGSAADTRPAPGERGPRGDRPTEDGEVPTPGTPSDDATS